MAESFDGDWLDLREPYDAGARNAELAAMLAASLPARPRLLDLGAGTGSLLRWLGHFIGRAQSWTLVDSDAELLARAFDTIAERAEAVGWPATNPGRSPLLVQPAHGSWLNEAYLAAPSARPANFTFERVGGGWRPGGASARFGSAGGGAGSSRQRCSSRSRPDSSSRRSRCSCGVGCR